MQCTWAPATAQQAKKTHSKVKSICKACLCSKVAAHYQTVLQTEGKPRTVQEPKGGLYICCCQGAERLYQHSHSRTDYLNPLCEETAFLLNLHFCCRTVHSPLPRLLISIFLYFLSRADQQDFFFFYCTARWKKLQFWNQQESCRRWAMYLTRMLSGLLRLLSRRKMLFSLLHLWWISPLNDCWTRKMLVERSHFASLPTVKPILLITFYLPAGEIFQRCIASTFRSLVLKMGKMHLPNNKMDCEIRNRVGLSVKEWHFLPDLDDYRIWTFFFVCFVLFV